MDVFQVRPLAGQLFQCMKPAHNNNPATYQETRYNLRLTVNPLFSVP